MRAHYGGVTTAFWILVVSHAEAIARRFCVSMTRTTGLPWMGARARRAGVGPSPKLRSIASSAGCWGRVRLCALFARSYLCENNGIAFSGSSRL